MATFSLDYDDVDFTIEDPLPWGLAPDDDSLLDQYYLQEAQRGGIDKDVLSNAAGDSLQGWLDQQVLLDDGPPTDPPNFRKIALGSATSSTMDTSITQAPFQAAPRHDSNTSLQSMASIASSSSRRGQRIVGAYPCMQCDRTFDVPSDLRHHERNHMAASSRPYKCHYCCQRFLYPKDRTRHVMRKHTSADAQPGSLSRTQSMDDVVMLSVDDPVPVIDTWDQQNPSFEQAAVSKPALVAEVTRGNGGSDELITDPLREESMRFSESALERLQNRLESVHKDLMSVREQRFEIAGTEIQTRAVTAKAAQIEPDLTTNNSVEPTTNSGIDDMQRIIARQQLQIDRLKLEVQFATHDAAFWLEECNHYAWFLRKIPKAPRPPIYMVPEQTGRVSLVQYAKGWLGAIGVMFSTGGVEAKVTDVASHLIDRLVGEIDHLAVQD
ncbi:hypothetical protein PRZ48_001962 [Zasmidium cellare]|uniref:C2H2-type domain-containing protein n=1 Tax=Zasmidium cellare TaxID=395010 RepID=A0ABR0F2P3_ZASCE|nr:hypothetical protein PRZ48_001962 [Zasmidium cellare]